jgi:hypothetical protein
MKGLKGSGRICSMRANYDYETARWGEKEKNEGMEEFENVYRIGNIRMRTGIG